MIMKVSGASELTEANLNPVNIMVIVKAVASQDIPLQVAITANASAADSIEVTAENTNQ
jgi:hypothetical protein